MYDYQQVSNGSTAVADTCNVAIVSDNNGRFYISGSTLYHNSMTTNTVTDSVTVRASNAANTGAYKDASISVSNSKSYTNYEIVSVSIGDVAANGSQSGNPTTIYKYYYTYTAYNGANYSYDQFKVTGRGNSGSEYVSYSFTPSVSGAALYNTSGAVYGPNRYQSSGDRRALGVLYITYGG